MACTAVSSSLAASASCWAAALHTPEAFTVTETSCAVGLSVDAASFAGDQAFVNARREIGRGLEDARVELVEAGHVTSAKIMAVMPNASMNTRTPAKKMNLLQNYQRQKSGPTSPHLLYLVLMRLLEKKN